MLEHIPAWLGHLLRDRRAGHEKLVSADPALALPAASFDLSSPAFAAGGRIPIRFTADGEGVSPPLVWTNVPAGARSLALIVEDPDAPTAQPLVHAIIWRMPPDDRSLREGAIAADYTDGNVGKHSYLQAGWLPPDPPTGHGEHDYVFQLFALADTPALPEHPGRSAIVDAIAGRVLATAVLIGTYSRGEPSTLDSAERLNAPAIGAGSASV